MKLSSPYLKINTLVFLCLTVIFVYAGLFSPAQDKYPVPSLYNKIMDKPSPTTGLSHSFSAVIRGKVREAKKWNPYGPRLFAFFLGEWFLRILFSVLWWKNPFVRRFLVPLDILLALTGFILAYGKLIFFWNYF